MYTGKKHTISTLVDQKPCSAYSPMQKKLIFCKTNLREYKLWNPANFADFFRNHLQKKTLLHRLEDLSMCCTMYCVASSGSVQNFSSEQEIHNHSYPPHRAIRRLVQNVGFISYLFWAPPLTSRKIRRPASLFIAPL